MFPYETIKSGNIAHAYIFFGPDNEKTALAAVDFAKILNCTGRKDNLTPCNECVSCKKIDSLNHPDIVRIRSEGTTPQIKIEQIRYLKKEAYLKPTEANTKVFIIYDAQAMNQEASNCLLKVLEEPPNNVIIILISAHLGGLLPTVVSRCQVIRFNDEARRAKDETIIDEFINIEDEFSSDRLEFVKRPKGEQLKTIDCLLEHFNGVLTGQFLDNGKSKRYPAEALLALMEQLLRSKDLLQSNVNAKLVADRILQAMAALRG